MIGPKEEGADSSYDAPDSYRAAELESLSTDPPSINEKGDGCGKMQTLYPFLFNVDLGGQG
jgi:hypothetical protein